ncbi:MAG: ABC transporter ATP-binding protein [Acidobacteriia bacterium]|nr:ABC transporter ATP-binding protein [Terriglobia bacterium]
MIAINIHELTKDYFVGFWRKRRVRALDQLSLTVNEGEIFGFLGPNGAGKTTTLKLLMRLIYPTSGHAEILGKPFDDVAMHAHIGYLPENPYFYDYLTAEEFLAYSGRLFGLSSTRVKSKIDELLQVVDLKDARRLQLRKFSKGMLQRAGIAQALINDPEIIFLDEPMSGLDPIGRREIRDLILGLKREGKTVFFSTHILPDVETLCDRVAIIYKGKLLGCGSLTELLVGDSSAIEMVVSQFNYELQTALRLIATDQNVAGNMLRLTLPDQAALFNALDAVRAHGGQVVHVHPLKESFEDYFVKLFANESISKAP